MSTSEKTAADVSTLPLLLPQDILVEILSKLPAKSLVRLRCVSKCFCALIADHGFAVLHRTLSLTLPSRTGILISIMPRAPSPPAYYTINFSEENPRPGMLQANRLAYLDSDEPFLKGCLRSSSDGLICLSRPPNGEGEDDAIVVCNVSTGQHIFLPTIPPSHSPPSSTCAHLGFDSQSNRYKVLMSAWIGGILEEKHWVLTVGVDKSWREINYSSSLPFHPSNGYALPKCCDTSVYIDGVIYSYNWLSTDDPPNFNIVAFEVGSESSSLIPIPAEVPSHSRGAFGEKYHYSDLLLRNFALLQVDGGRLAIVQIRQIGSLFYMDVWTWEKSKECWEKITMTIPLELQESSGTINYLRYTTNHVGEIVLLRINSERFSILVCNLKSEVWRQFDVGGVEEFPILPSTDVRMYRTMDNVFSL